MVFIIVQIRSGPKILKPWYGCIISESYTLSDIYTEFSSGRIDGGLPVPDEYLGKAVQAFLGPKKTELTPVNSKCTVGEAISVLHHYVKYRVSVLPIKNLEAEARVDALAILMKGAQLQFNKLGWKVLYGQQIGVVFVNTWPTHWTIDRNYQMLAD